MEAQTGAGTCPLAAALRGGAMVVVVAAVEAATAVEVAGAAMEGEVAAAAVTGEAAAVDEMRRIPCPVTLTTSRPGTAHGDTLRPSSADGG